MTCMYVCMYIYIQKVSSHDSHDSSSMTHRTRFRPSRTQTFHRTVPAWEAPRPSGAWDGTFSTDGYPPVI